MQCFYFLDRIVSKRIGVGFLHFPRESKDHATVIASTIMSPRTMLVHFVSRVAQLILRRKPLASSVSCQNGVVFSKEDLRIGILGSSVTTATAGTVRWLQPTSSSRLNLQKFQKRSCAE